MEFLKSAVASAISKGPAFPYTFGDRVDLDQSIWTLHNGTKREDGSNCSIFSFDITADRSRLPLAKNAVRKLRTLRHPGIIKVLDTVETETYIYVATERIIPLGWHVRRKSLSEETAKWGLFTVASTLRFINDEATSVHGNMRVSSIFTSESGEWRLGGLDILSSLKEEDAVIYSSATLLPDISRYSPPEVTKSGWGAIKNNPLPALDAYDFGLLLYEVFNGGTGVNDTIGQTKNIPQVIQQSYKRLLNSNPKARLSVSHFLEQGRRTGGFFETPLIKLSEGLENLGLKSDEERAELLSELDEVSDDFPEDFFKMKILPELLKSVEFGGGGPKVFGYIMKIGAKISDDEFETCLNPVILRLFASPDRQIRVCLLDNLPRMIDHFSQSVVSNKIFPQIITGFTDVAPVVREQTVKAVLTLVTKLTDRIINGELLRHLAKTANDEQPGIRTNTTICLGKIAKNLGTSTRQKVLIAAFSRSLKDPFVHGRNSALQALAATADLFPEEDCAQKVLPAICSVLVDKEKIVRDQANKTFDIYVSRIRKYASALPETLLPPPSSATSNGTTPRIGTPANVLANESSWAGWAISSFTNKLAAATGEIQAKSNSITSSAPATRSSSVPASAMPRSTDPTSTVHPIRKPFVLRPTMPPEPQLGIKPSLLAAQGSQDVDDGGLDEAWGDMDGDAFFDAPTTSASVVPNSLDDSGEPDFAGWLSAQQQAKTKPPLPKGLTKASAAKHTANGSVRPATGRISTTGSVGAGLGPKKMAGTTQSAARLAPVTKKVEDKAVDTRPKEGGEDDWGDAWD